MLDFTPLNGRLWQSKPSYYCTTCVHYPNWRFQLRWLVSTYVRVRDYLWCTSKLGFQKFLTKFSITRLFWNLVSTPPPPIEIVPRVQVWPYPEPPPQIENSNFLSRVQISPYPEHPPPQKIENTNFLSRFQNWLYKEHPPPLKTLICFPESKSDLTQNTLPPNWKLQFSESKSDLIPSPPQWQLKYMETNGCIPQGYHLVDKWGYNQREGVVYSHT